MADASEFGNIFAELRLIFRSLESKLDIIKDDAAEFCANSRKPWSNGKELYFGGAVIKKNYVSFYLMPVYMYPDLLDGTTEALRKRMQGKSCFNFTKYDRPLIRELATLTKVSFERLRNEGYA
ncbi:MAG: hypothetical protein M5R41_14095 [Bacteroidia bacterium]|nr:hypothetical protein [Bacteroidia bacterium]